MFRLGLCVCSLARAHSAAAPIRSVHGELTAEFGDCVGELRGVMGVSLGRIGMGVACEGFPVTCGWDS